MRGAAAQQSTKQLQTHIDQKWVLGLLWKWKCLHFPAWCQSRPDPSAPAHWVEPGNCANSAKIEIFYWHLGIFRFPLSELLTVISSLRLLPLRSRYVSELEILWLSVSECDIWLTPFEVSPQWAKASLHRPLDTLAMGPAKWMAPNPRKKQYTISYRAKCWPTHVQRL